jgi:septal ring factor EnvC (AmiA/AmiB activator)
MSDETVTLDFLARQLRRVIDDIGAVKDEMRVQTGIILRLERDAAHRDERDAAMLNQLRAMVSQHQRFSDRLAGLDERLSALESERR